MIYLKKYIQFKHARFDIYSKPYYVCITKECTCFEVLVEIYPNDVLQFEMLTQNRISKAFSPELDCNRLRFNFFLYNFIVKTYLKGLKRILV